MRYVALFSYCSRKTRAMCIKYNTKIVRRILHCALLELKDLKRNAKKKSCGKVMFGCCRLELKELETIWHFRELIGTQKLFRPNVTWSSKLLKHEAHEHSTSCDTINASSILIFPPFSALDVCVHPIARRWDHASRIQRSWQSSSTN